MRVKATLLGVFLIIMSILFCYFAASNSLMVQGKPSLNLSFYKNNGYGMGNDMNGLWTINTDVSADIQHVEFYFDDQLQLNDTAAPFSWPFDTNNYTEGLHTIKVVAFDSSGGQVVVEQQRNFVGFPTTFVVAIIAIIVVATIVSLVFGIFRSRRQEEKERLDRARKHT